MLALPAVLVLALHLPAVFLSSLPTCILLPALLVELIAVLEPALFTELSAILAPVLTLELPAVLVPVLTL